MDSFVTLIIFFIVIALLEKVLKAATGGGKGATAAADAPPEEEWEVEDDEARVEGVPADLRDLIVEELGMDMERVPRVLDEPRRRPGPPVTAVPDERLRVVDRRERREAEREVPWQVPARATPAAVEERAVRERGAAVSLERPRVPEDHDRFHERYELPQPVRTHTEFHDRYRSPEPLQARRARREPLPELSDWSAAQKAIVWSEILGPPKGFLY